MNFLRNKRILVGVTGSIAAYKSADLVRKLKEQGAHVRVAMTQHAKEFITPLTMQAISGHPVHDDLFDPQAEAAMGHIELARWADVILIAPASADFIARLAHGEGNDLLTTLCLAAKCPIIIAPAMNQGMWHHVQTQENSQRLQAKGVHFYGPAEGSQACGDVGFGRMLEPQAIITELSQFFATGLLAGVEIIITAGPTHEAIDPIRFISNNSSGKMGYALGQAAVEAGANVTLISGPVHLTPPEGVEIIRVVSAEEMQKAVFAKINTCDLFIGVAAVGDYRAETIATAKIAKTAATLQLTLVRNPDIISAVGQLNPKPFIVGFAAETENVIANAQQKMQRKNMDMIIANHIAPAQNMGTEDNEVIVLAKHLQQSFPRMDKRQLAKVLMELIAHEFKQGKNNGNKFAI